jgi:hypothetical protein
MNRPILIATYVDHKTYDALSQRALAANQAIPTVASDLLEAAAAHKEAGGDRAGPATRRQRIWPE